MKYKFNIKKLLGNMTTLVSFICLSVLISVYIDITNNNLYSNAEQRWTSTTIAVVETVKKIREGVS